MMSSSEVLDVIELLEEAKGASDPEDFLKGLDLALGTLYVGLNRDTRLAIIHEERKKITEDLMQCELALIDIRQIVPDSELKTFLFNLNLYAGKKDTLGGVYTEVADALKAGHPMPWSTKQS